MRPTDWLILCKAAQISRQVWDTWPSDLARLRYDSNSSLTEYENKFCAAFYLVRFWTSSADTGSFPSGWCINRQSSWQLTRVSTRQKEFWAITSAFTRFTSWQNTIYCIVYSVLFTVRNSLFCQVIKLRLFLFSLIDLDPRIIHFSSPCNVSVIVYRAKIVSK